MTRIRWILLILLAMVLTACNASMNCPPNCIEANLMNKNWEVKDLKNANFSKANLSRANLSNSDLLNADLRGADLRGAKLNGANLKNASLVGANLEEAKLVAVNLENADLSGAKMTNAVLVRANMTNVKMDGCDLTEANLAGANLTHVRISGCTLIRAKFFGADMSDSALSGDDLSGADLSGATFTNADLSGSNLTGAILIGTHLNKAKLTGATLVKATLNGSDLRLADLQGANLQDASIKGASMDKANLASSNLTGTNFQGSVLTEANLSMARFAGVVVVDGIPTYKSAILGGASLNRADLSYAYLAGVSFRGASLNWVNTSNAVFKEIVEIGNIKVVQQADWTGAIRDASDGVSTQSPSVATPVPVQTLPATPQTTPAVTATPGVSSMLKIGMQETISNLNPLLPLTVIENDALDQIYETLFILQPDGVYHPALVNKFSVSQDGRQYSLTLQANGTFHDGEPLTAKDVVFSLDFYKKLWGLSFLEKVEAPDDTTILLSLAEPVPDIGYKLGQLYILPEHIWGPMAGDPNQLKAFKNEKPVGSGLFKVTDFQPGKSLRFIANKTYWKDQPKVDEMLWKTYNQQDDMVQALIKGEIDAIANLPITTTNALKSLPNIRVISGPPVKPVFNDIIFNLIDPEKCPKKGQDQCTGNPALQDVRVRQALAHATDKKTIIEITTSNTAKAGLTIVTDRQEPWFNTNLQDYTYDLNQANQILDEAGYKDGNKDGIREIPRTNSPLVLRLYYPGGYPKYTYERLAELLKKDWNTIGIQVTEKSLDENTLHDIINPNFNFDMILWGYGGLQPDPNNMLSILTTRAIASGRSDTGYANPEYDTLFDQQRIEMNPEKRKEIIWKMQEIMLKDVPYIIPYYERTAYAVSTEHFSGWTFNQEKIMPLYAENLAKIALIR